MFKCYDKNKKKRKPPPPPPTHHPVLYSSRKTPPCQEVLAHWLSCACPFSVRTKLQGKAISIPPETGTPCLHVVIKLLRWSRRVHGPFFLALKRTAAEDQFHARNGFAFERLSVVGNSDAPGSAEVSVSETRYLGPSGSIPSVYIRYPKQSTPKSDRILLYT